VNVLSGVDLGKNKGSYGGQGSLEQDIEPLGLPRSYFFTICLISSWKNIVLISLTRTAIRLGLGRFLCYVYVE
jgi:hypothetical protein